MMFNHSPRKNLNQQLTDTNITYMPRTVLMTRPYPHPHHQQHLHSHHQNHQLSFAPFVSEQILPPLPDATFADISGMDRRQKKPMMEKRRRARMNVCFDKLKELLLNSDLHKTFERLISLFDEYIRLFKHAKVKMAKVRSKLEKSDILEKTVEFLNMLIERNSFLERQIHIFKLSSTTDSKDNGIFPKLAPLPSINSADVLSSSAAVCRSFRPTQPILAPTFLNLRHLFHQQVSDLNQQQHLEQSPFMFPSVAASMHMLPPQASVSTSSSADSFPRDTSSSGAVSRAAELREGEASVFCIENKRVAGDSLLELRHDTDDEPVDIMTVPEEDSGIFSPPTDEAISAAPVAASSMSKKKKKSRGSVLNDDDELCEIGPIRPAKKKIIKSRKPNTFSIFNILQAKKTVNKVDCNYLSCLDSASLPSLTKNLS